MLQNKYLNKKNIRRISFLLVCLLCFANSLFAADVISSDINSGSVDISTEGKLVILFTNDMHSNVDSLSNAYQREVNFNGKRIKIAGGFARLATLIEQQREICKEEGTPLLVVDAGDMAMGTVFQSLYSSNAVELSSMASMGYDAFCLGNHDFDYGADATASMLLAAKERGGERFPQLLSANIKPISGSELEDAFAKIGAKKSILFEKEGVKIGVIGSVSKSAYELMSDNNKLTFIEPVELLQNEVDSLHKLGAEYIILISHGGTLGKKGNFYLSPDGLVADKVKGIDAIISGHDHDFLFEPLSVGETKIVSSGSNLNYLGKMVFEGGKLSSYELIPLDTEVKPSDAMQREIDCVNLELNSNFYKMFGVKASDTLGVLNESLEMVLDSTGNIKLGTLISNSYSAEAERVTCIENVIGVSMYGTVRGGLAKGVVTINDVFNMLSLGVSADGKPGSPLALVWITGEELEGLCEVSATISKYMIDATISFCGVEFEYNPNRIPFTKVTNVKVYGEELVDDRLYPVVTGTYTANLISLVKSESKGLISIVLKDSSGKPIKSVDSSIIFGATPEWLAFSNYLKSNVVGVDNIEYTKCRTAVDSKSIYIFYSAIVLSIIVLIVYLIKRRRVTRTN